MILSGFMIQMDSNIVLHRKAQSGNSVKPAAEYLTEMFR